ncbi:uncharacterized protein LOC124648818 [Lolium rigidum]|uniref:uncharacterized protein LOC124648818 n=1 Tax=Lolium rigidum TaxID=89674 RepID=UPI001F5DFD9B|nr:uncharacterized protein LOC124648818 [Lolium rigidum]
MGIQTRRETRAGGLTAYSAAATTSTHPRARSRAPRSHKQAKQTPPRRTTCSCRPAGRLIAQAQVDEYVASTAILPPLPDDPVNTVQVKFVLQRQCAFGQRFLVVGDDPALGLWDPTKAAALEWSEGHVWTARMDLPANRAIEFKFLLQDPSGQVSWQHGHNRTLQIAETSKTLVVYEDWDDAKCQEVLEVTYPSIGAEDVHFAGSYNGAILPDDNEIHENQQTDKVMTDVAGTDGGSSPQRENMRANGANGLQVTDSPALRPLDGHRLLHTINHTAAYGFLTQFTLEKDHKVPDVLRRRAKVAVQTLNDEGAPVENRAPAGMFENDMAWVSKALQRLLRSLGLQIGTTET